MFLLFKIVEEKLQESQKKNESKVVNGSTKTLLL